MYRRFTTESAAKAAIKREGLHLMTVDYPVTELRGVRAVEPLVIVNTADDMHEIWDRGFNSRIDKTRAVQEPN
jgi:hypothetical protein